MFISGIDISLLKSSHGSRCEFQASKAFEMCDGVYKAGDTMNSEYKLLGSIYISRVDFRQRSNIHVDFNLQEIIIRNRFMLNAQIQIWRTNKSQMAMRQFCKILISL